MLLSGNVRDIDRTAATVMSSVVEALDADVFVHTWDVTDHRDPTWWREAGQEDRGALRTDPELLQRLLRPSSMIVEPTRIFSTRSVPASEPGLQLLVSSIMSLWFGVHEAFRLMCDHEIARGSQYDHVVRWRFDLVPSRPLGPGDLDGALRLAPWSASRPIALSSDVAAVGPRELMERYASIFTTMPSSIDEFMAESTARGFSHEAFLAARLRGMDLQWSDLEVGTTLIRPDGSELVISSADSRLHPRDLEPDHLHRFFAPSQRDQVAAVLCSRLELAGCPDATTVTAALLGSTTPMSVRQTLQTFRVLRSFAEWLERSEPTGRVVAASLLARWWPRYRRSTTGLTRARVLLSPAFWRLWSIGASSRVRLRARTRAGELKRAIGALPAPIRRRPAPAVPEVTTDRLPSREFNQVIVDRRTGVVRKSSEHSRTLLDEIEYLEALPPELRACFAPVRGSSTDPRRPHLELGYVAGRPLDQLFLDDAGAAHEWSSIWESVADVIDAFAGHRHTVSIDALREMYVVKTDERLAACMAFPDLRRVLERPSLVINGVEHRDLMSLVRRAQDRVADVSGAQGSVIHGDLCLSNILRTGDGVTLIDPRGRFGEVGIHGDLRYDIAKLHHSVVGGYDHLVAGRFSFDLGADDIAFDLQFSPRQREIAALSRTRILSRWSADEIELISGLILAGLAPLHSEAPTRQIAFLLRATELLSAVLDGHSTP